MEQLALWVEAGDNHRVRQQLQVLVAEHSRLYQEYRAMPTEMMRARCLQDIERKEQEIGELRGRRGGQLALRRLALLRVLAEIRCEFQPVRKGKRTFQVLSSITFVRQLGDPIKYDGTPVTASWPREPRSTIFARPMGRSAIDLTFSTE